MKTHLIILLICIPCLLFAQNYEKEGDELFAKAQYEKAEKKYAAAIEITGSNAALNQKKAKCAKCLSLLTKAQTAERQANDIKSYELARTYYLDLYKEHALSAHKNKADAMRQKANAIAEQQRVAEQAERDRLAKIEQEKRDKAEAEQKARIEREKRAQEQKIAQQEEEARKAKAREDAAAKKRKAEAERKQKEVENLSQLSQILNAPLGLSNIKWTDSKRKQKKALLQQYPELSVSRNYILSGNVAGPTYHYTIRYATFNLNYEDGNEVYVVYTMNTPGAIAAEKTAKNIHYDLRRYGFIMSPISYGMSSCKKSEIIKGISFSSMKLEYDKNGNIYIRFAINRLKSNMTIQKKSYSTEKTHTEMDIQDMDNTTPFNVIKWSVNYQSSVYDAWFSEKAGLITDDNRWIGGMSESMGWYALHRFNKEQYTCNFIRSSNSLGEDGYGGNLGFLKAVRDRERNTLPIKNGYYVLDLRDWPDYRPLYLPYSKGFIKSHWGRGMIIFEYR